MVSGEEASVIVIGSSNLTRGGLVANYEAGVGLKLDLKQGADREIYEEVAHYVQRLREDATCQPLTEDPRRALPGPRSRLLRQPHRQGPQDPQPHPAAGSTRVHRHHRPGRLTGTAVTGGPPGRLRRRCRAPG